MNRIVETEYGNGPETATSTERPRVQSAARTVAILQVVARSERGLRGKEIAEQLGLPRQVAYHLIHTLTSAGMLRRGSTTRYVLGLGVSSLAEGFRRQLAPPEYLAPIVRSIATRTGETAYAVGWVDGAITVLATARGAAAVHAAEVPHGYSTDAHARASGKLILSLMPEHQLATQLAHMRWVRRTPNTIVKESAFREELKKVRAQRYAIDDEEFSPGLTCLAVPVEPSEAGFVMTISAPTERFWANFETNLKILREAGAIGTDA
jgi:IclR family transcriptional regulator, acetate operon repressor